MLKRKEQRYGLDSVHLNRMGSEVHIQRSSFGDHTPSTDGMYNDGGPQAAASPTLAPETDDSTFREFGDGDLGETIGALVENQREIIQTLEGGDSSTLESYGREAGKGLIGSTTAGLVTMATMHPVAGHLAGNAMSKMAEKAYDNHFDAGASKLTDLSSSAFDKLDAIIDEKIRQRLQGVDYGGKSTGDAKSRR